MTDVYALLRESLAHGVGLILNIPFAAKQFDCPAEGCAARSALPLKHQADAVEWAFRLQANLDAVQFLGKQLLRRVDSNEGHLLFDFTDEFFTLAVRLILRELPAITDIPISIEDDDAVRARVGYTIRRMWMLARHRKAGEECPKNADVQHALLVALAIGEKDITKRALECRLLAASDALLTMTHGVLPRQRPGLCKASAWVGDATARLCIYGLERLQQEEERC